MNGRMRDRSWKGDEEESGGREKSSGGEKVSGRQSSSANEAAARSRWRGGNRETEVVVRLFKSSQRLIGQSNVNAPSIFFPGCSLRHLATISLMRISAAGPTVISGKRKKRLKGDLLGYPRSAFFRSTLSSLLSALP